MRLCGILSNHVVTIGGGNYIFVLNLLVLVDS